MRRALLLAVAVVLIAAVGVVALRSYAASRLERARSHFEAEIGSLDPASYAPEPVEQDLNAAFWLLSGSEAMPFEKQPEIVMRRVQSLDSPWSADDEAAFVALRTEVEPARATMDRALGLERSNQGIDYTSIEVDRRDPLVLLRAANFLSVDCDLAIQRGELQAAIADVALLERMAAVERHEPLLLAVLLGSAIENAYHGRLEALLGAVVETSDLERLDETLRHLERSGATAHRALAHQGALFHDFFASILTAAPSGASSTEASRNEAGDNVTRRLLRFDWLLLANQLEVMSRLAQRTGEPSAGIDWEQWYEESGRAAPGLPDVTTPMLVPNLIDAIQKEQVTLAARRLAATALELRRARLETGAYPPSLADPPRSDFTGEAATYRRLDDGGVEIAFAESLRAWEAKFKGGVPQGVRAPNLVWRLPA